MNINSLLYLFIGVTIGLILRICLINQFQIKKLFYVENVSLVNFLASFILGILVAFEPRNENIILLVYVGFLGCFSTYSSFIYQLFVLFERGQFVRLVLHYIEVITISLLLFYLGFYFIKGF